MVNIEYVECGKGWKKLYQPIIDWIEDYNSKHEEKIEILQIKEKWGGLRFYAGPMTEELRNMITEAEIQSYKTCEYCGSEENVGLLGDGWYSTLCKNCAQELVNKQNRIRRFKTGDEITELKPTSTIDVNA